MKRSWRELRNDAILGGLEILAGGGLVKGFVDRAEGFIINRTYTPHDPILEVPYYGLIAGIGVATAAISAVLFYDGAKRVITGRGLVI